MKNDTVGPWVYRAYEADIPAEAFGPLASFVTLWRNKCPAPGTFPAWRDFDLMDFQDWWGQMSLAELHDDPFDLRWALWGTVLVNWWNVDYTNKFMSEIGMIQEVWESQERDYLERLIAGRLIGHVTGTLAPQNRKFIHISGVDLPLEKDGRITHILSAYQLCTPDAVVLPSATPVFMV